MYVDNVHGLQTLPQQETTAVETPPTSESHSAIREESLTEEGVDFGRPSDSSRRSSNERKFLRRSQPPRLLNKTMSNGREREETTVQTKGESTSNSLTSTSIDLKQVASIELEQVASSRDAEKIERTLLISLTPPNTDPLHRRANGRMVDQKGGVAERSVASALSTTKLGNFTSLTPVHQRSKSKVEEVEEPDAGNLSSYIAQLRSRGHKRATSAPIRHQLQTTPTGRAGAFAHEKKENVQQNTTAEEKKVREGAKREREEGGREGEKERFTREM